MPTSVGYLSITTIHWPRLKAGEVGPVFGVALVFTFGAVDEAGGLRSALAVFTDGDGSALWVGALGPAAATPPSATAPDRRLSSVVRVDPPRVRMNANTATIAAAATVAAPTALCERWGLRAWVRPYWEC